MSAENIGSKAYADLCRGDTADLNPSRRKTSVNGKMTVAAGSALVSLKKDVHVPGMDVWTWGLLGIGSFLAISTLVALMRRRRDELFAELSTQAREEQHKKKLEEMLEKKKQKKRA
jgi:hypothetical protein